MGEHPPVADASGLGEPGARTGRSAFSGSTSTEGVLGRRQDESWSWNIRKVRTPVLVYRDRGAIEGEDRVGHRAVEALDHDERVGFGTPEVDEPASAIGPRERQLRVHPPLA